MPTQAAGETTHFIVQYDDAAGAPALAVANDVLAICESDLAKLSVHMPYHTGTAGDPFIHTKIAVLVMNDPLKGPPLSSADNNGFFPGRQSLIRMNPFTAPGVTISADGAGFLFVLEMSEILMVMYGWDAGSSQGEGLSHVMGDELHPASIGNVVNTWLGWPRPRPDWISRNESEGSGLLVRGDRDPIAYGCAAIFINFLRYQLGFSFSQICGAGGTLLSDRYRNLTGAADDPAARVGALLDSHFGTGAINIVGNNPFPLYEGAARRVLLAFGKRTAKNHLLPQGGRAHVKPFFNCPAADYPYTEIGSSVTQTITATTVGIGFPSFKWFVNGKELVWNRQTGDSVAAPVDVPDPQNPDQPKRQNQTFQFDYEINNNFDTNGGSSSLTITSQSFGGDYQIDVRVDADETAAPTGSVSATQGITIHTRSVIYGGTYAADQQRCQESFEKAMSGRLHVVQDSLSRLHNLPDPPDPRYLTQILEAANHIRQELEHLAAADHATANKIAQYVAVRTGVPAKLFLKGARGGPTSAE